MRPAGGSLVAEAAHGVAVAPEALKHRRRTAVSLAVSAMLLVGIGTPLLFAGAPAGADQVSTLQQQAQYIAGEIQAANIRLTILDEQFHQAEGRVAFFAQRVSDATAAITRTEKALDLDRSHLRAVAIEALRNRRCITELVGCVQRQPADRWHATGLYPGRIWQSGRVGDDCPDQSALLVARTGHSRPH